MRRLWLLFAQTVTIALALYFVYSAVPRPNGRGAAPVFGGAPPAVLADSSLPPSQGSFRAAAGRAMPAVVNILTTKAVRKHTRWRATRFSRNSSANATRTMNRTAWAPASSSAPKAIS